MPFFRNFKWPQLVSSVVAPDSESSDSFLNYPYFFLRAIAKEQEKKKNAQHTLPQPPNYQAYLNSYAKLDPKPQTYAEELPHRPQLRQLGVQFEPYPNA